MQKNIIYNMKYIKQFESEKYYKREHCCYLSLYNLEDSKSSEGYVFYTEEANDNFIINYVNEEIKIAYENDEIFLDPVDVGAIKDESNIPVFIDKEEAMEWFNENSRESNKSSSCIMISDFVEIVSNVQLDKKVIKLREIKKYNL